MTAALAAHQAAVALAISGAEAVRPSWSASRAAAMSQRQSPRTTTWSPTAGGGGQSGSAGAAEGPTT